MGFTAAERDALVSEVIETRRRYRPLQIKASASPEAGRLVDRLNTLLERYRAGVPSVALSRCPFCGAVATHSLDERGLDGPWWDFDHPIRPPHEPACPHWYGFSGAMQLDREHLEEAPHIALPGPEVPFVVPGILEADEAIAVITRVEVGAHTGFAICYFVDGPTDELEGVNDWGSNDYTVYRADGGRGWNTATPDVDRYDFELAPWVTLGKVAWIAPGDETLVLRRELEGCPYVGLPGRRALVRVQNGIAWSSVEELMAQV